jgi:20S proteasome alpha/beta subunit
MTLIAGFTGRGGSVLCSDLLEVSGGYAKKPVDKILTAEGDHTRNFEYAVGCSGNGPYMDMLLSELRRALEVYARIDVDLETDLDPACCDLRDAIVAELTKALTAFYATHIWPKGANADKIEMQFLAAVQPRPYGEAFLVKIVETAVTVVEESYACIGIGSYLADYILENMHSGTGEKEFQFALASFVLTEVNENIDGCGKGYSIYHFDGDGTLDWRFSDYHAEDFSHIKNLFGYAFQAMTDFGEHQDKHGFTPERIGQIVAEERAARLERIRKDLAMRLEFQKSVDQQ